MEHETSALDPGLSIRMNTIRAAVIPALLLSLALLTGCKAGNKAEEKKEEAAIPIEVATATLGAIDAAYRGTATLEAENEATVLAKQSGTVEQVLVEEALLAAGFGAVPVGTVDKFQGQEAAVAIVSLAASSGRDAPRGLEFLLLQNRLNVAVSRADERPPPRKSRTPYFRS